MQQTDFTVTLSAPQADTLEDALLTFAPGIKPLIAATRGGFTITLDAQQLPQAVDALESYRDQIRDCRSIRDTVRTIRMVGARK